MKKLIFAFVLVSVISLKAQTINTRLTWTTQDTILDAQSFTYTLKVDTNAPVAIPAPTCTVNTTAPIVTTCVSVLPSPLQLSTATSHTLVLTAYNPYGSASSDPLTGNSPAKPGSFRSQIIINIP